MVVDFKMDIIYKGKERDGGKSEKAGWDVMRGLYIYNATMVTGQRCEGDGLGFGCAPFDIDQRRGFKTGRSVVSLLTEMFSILTVQRIYRAT